MSEPLSHGDVVDPTFDESGFAAWLATRPPVIQVIAQRAVYNRWYRLKTTGQRGFLYSYSEDGTVTMDLRYDWDPIGYRVFGINPDDLEPCAAPPDVP